MQGRITKWRGSYGFIRFGGEDIFVHLRSFLSGSVPELNCLVEFQLGPAVREDKPHQAVNVRVIKRAAEVIADFNQSHVGLDALKQGGAL